MHVMTSDIWVSRKRRWSALEALRPSLSHRIRLSGAQLTGCRLQSAAQDAREALDRSYTGLSKATCWRPPSSSTLLPPSRRQSPSGSESVAHSDGRTLLGMRQPREVQSRARRPGRALCGPGVAALTLSLLATPSWTSTCGPDRRRHSSTTGFWPTPSAVMSSGTNGPARRTSRVVPCRLRGHG